MISLFEGSVKSAIKWLKNAKYQVTVYFDGSAEESRSTFSAITKFSEAENSWNIKMDRTVLRHFFSSISSLKFWTQTVKEFQNQTEKSIDYLFSRTANEDFSWISNNYFTIILFGQMTKHSNICRSSFKSTLNRYFCASN